MTSPDLFSGPVAISQTLSPPAQIHESGDAYARLPNMTSPSDTSTPSSTNNASNPSNLSQNGPSEDTNDSMPALRVDPARLSTLTANISSIRSRIAAALPKSSNSNSPSRQPRLVAVSKLKPATDIYALLQQQPEQEGQRHFGENYVQELLEKSKILWEQSDGVGKAVRWHFIGGLQSNKATQLARECRGLWCVESVDSMKKARGLEKGWGERIWKTEDVEGNDDGRLRVMIQVNTSGEENKSGVEPESKELVELARCVVDECKGLRLAGLMTIGAIARSRAAKEGEENEDFEKLKDVRGWLAKELGWEEEKLELSMGMSEDFESAVRLGSSEVRIGSTIFGERPPKAEAKVV